MKPILGPAQGILRLYLNDLPAGDPADFYAAERKVGPVMILGEFDFEAGANSVFLTLVGKNPRSRGLGFELAEIVFERVR